MVNREFLQRLGGALTAALVDAALEIYTCSDTKPWADKPLFGVEPLPPLDDWLVLGISLIPLLYGHFSHNYTIKTIGEGMTLYAIPMLTRVMACRVTR